jgi:hypothetical protein
VPTLRWAAWLNDAISGKPEYLCFSAAGFIMSHPPDMKKQTKNGKLQVPEDDLWINPKSNIRRERGNRADDDRLGAAAGARLLELADIALGLKKPQQKKKKKQQSVQSPKKTEPYSS